ncbi:GNAT family N-acetyltransferase [Cellulomonas bogoriensis]|uniref:Acetyltransferase n=1 Tax=Cellulomonas bogoriensis 69B4 = DSM 16987 TaxID=1386082 RepID=A0A0A0C2K6_9CELL|nr:GNAT family N-acetyltransferase [Cellulomonas bogoriensis]KGM14416.1 acetyltransferase [Cellulomonas bogoriensis 69B4 = DSM 16987]
MTVEVRPVRDVEVARVGELTAGAYLADELVAPDHGYLGELRDAVRRAEQATVLVALVDDRVVGTITVASPGSPYAEVAAEGEWELRMLAVDPGTRGQGVGEVLLRAGIDRARTAGAAAVVLSTMPSMHAARRMYDRLGLVRCPDRDWPAGGQVMLVYTTD